MGLPSVYLFYGDHRLAISETLKDMQEKLGSAAEFNLQQFSGAHLDLEELQATCLAVPFLADRRLIVIHEAESVPKDKSSRARLELLLDQLPATSAVVFIENTDLSRPKLEQDYQRKSFFYQWATSNGERAYVRRFDRPRGPAFVSWLERRSEGRIEPAAAQLLGLYLNEDPLLAEQELDKLLEFAAGDRSITIEDVQRLTPPSADVNVFAVVDELGAGPSALTQLQQLLDEQDPAYVFTMVVRQIRLLIQARDALDAGRDPLQSMRVPAFVARKATTQAKRFTSSELRSMYRELQHLDVSAKRGNANYALDLLPLVASLSI